MDIKFCENCDMKLDYYTDTEKTPMILYQGCKACGYKEETRENHCIYNNDYHIDLSQIINQNPFLEYDITLPSIEGNKNITCPNDECISNKEKKATDIIYIKYDHEKMKYSYICRDCKQCWTN